MLILSLKVNKLIFSGNSLTLHVICVVMGTGQYLFRNLTCFFCRFAFEKVGNITKTDLVTLIILLNARDLSKVI